MNIQYRSDFSGNSVTTYSYGTGGMVPSSGGGGGQAMVMMMPCLKPPPSTEDRFVFAAEYFAHMPGFKMFPEYITSCLPTELKGKIRESEWHEWMSILIRDRQSHACGDSFGCSLAALISTIFACYPCIRSRCRSKSIRKFMDKINTELFVPRGMFLKQQEGYMLGAPMVQGMSALAWFSIALNPTESEKLRKESSRVPLSF